jgi:hypothetical protein
MNVNVETHYFISGLSPEEKSLLRRVRLVPLKGRNARISPSEIYEKIAKLSNSGPLRKRDKETLVLMDNIFSMMKMASIQSSIGDSVSIDLSSENISEKDIDQEQDETV